jgi:hypothetical protein
VQDKPSSNGGDNASKETLTRVHNIILSCLYPVKKFPHNNLLYSRFPTDHICTNLPHKEFCWAHLHFFPTTTWCTHVSPQTTSVQIHLIRNSVEPTYTFSPQQSLVLTFPHRLLLFALNPQGCLSCTLTCSEKKLLFSLHRILATSILSIIKMKWSAWILKCNIFIASFNAVNGLAFV